MEEARVRQFQLEFQVPETAFLQNCELGEKTIDEQQRQLDQGANVKDILRKYKVNLCNSILHVLNALKM